MVVEVGAEAPNQATIDEVKLKKDINLIKNKNNLTPVVVLANADNKLAATMGERIIDIRALTDLTVARNLVRLDRLRLPQGEAWKEGGEGSLNATIAKTIEDAKEAIALAEKEAQSAKAEQDAKAAIAKATRAEKAKASAPKTASAPQAKAPLPKDQAQKFFTAKDQPITLTITVPEGATRARFSLTLGEEPLLLDTLVAGIKVDPVSIASRLTVVGDRSKLSKEMLGHIEKAEALLKQNKKPEKAVKAEKAPAVDTSIVPVGEITLEKDGTLRTTAFNGVALTEGESVVQSWKNVKAMLNARDTTLNVVGLTAPEIEKKIPEFKQFFQNRRDLVVGDEVAMNDLFTTPAYEPVQGGKEGATFAAEKNTKGGEITPRTMSNRGIMKLLEGKEPGVLVLTAENVGHLPYSITSKIVNPTNPSALESRLQAAEGVMTILEQRVADRNATVVPKKAEEEAAKNEGIAAVVDAVYEAAQARESVVEAPAPLEKPTTPTLTYAEETAAMFRDIADAISRNPDNPMMDAAWASGYAAKTALELGMKAVVGAEVVAANHNVAEKIEQTAEIARSY